MLKLPAIFITILLFFCSLTGTQKSKKPEELMKEIYPGSTVIVKNIILTDQQKVEAERLSGMKIGAKMVSFYLAVLNGNIIAYGYADAHPVRTHQELVLYTIRSSGEIDKVNVIAFNEPSEYMPSVRWLTLFSDKSLKNNSLIIRKDIDVMSGATLTSRAVTGGCRKALSLWEVLYNKKGN